MTASTAPGTVLPPIRVHTVNSARESTGSIHDDAKAREMGYAAGFVPGVTVLGYMLRLMHESFGDDWLRTGRFTGRLRRPTYAGVEVTVEGNIVEPPARENDGRVTVALRVLDPDGGVTALGTASCAVSADA
jgi:acyl dehydratase